MEVLSASSLVDSVQLHQRTPQAVKNARIPNKTGNCIIEFEHDADAYDQNIFKFEVSHLSNVRKS